MFVLLLVIHILVAALMVVSILLQSGQSGGLSGAFGGGGGGGGNQSLFGGRGAATFLSRATTYLGAGFLVVSLLLAYVQAHRAAPASAGRNLIQEQARQQAPAPVMPGGQTAPDQGLSGAGDGTRPAGGDPGAAEGLTPPAEIPAGEPPASAPPNEALPAGTEGP